MFWDDILGVGIEEPAGRNTGYAFCVQGALLSQIPARMLVTKFMPSEWRKAVNLPGNASKSDVLRFVVENGFESGWKTDERELAQDACDAYCIALATRTLIEQQAAA